MEVGEEGNSINMAPPPENNCINCAAEFTQLNGAINEIHIYTSTNEFERSISILDALTEIFATERLKIAKSSQLNILMCTKCAEIMSVMYKHYLNLTAQALSFPDSYLCQLLTHVIDNRHQKLEDPKGYQISFDLGLGDRDEDDDDYIPSLEYGSSGGEPDTEEGYKMKTRSQTHLEVQKTPLEPRLKGNSKGRNPTKGGIAKLQPRLLKCHQPLCNFSERYNFKLYEHVLSVHQKEEPSTCQCGFTFYPEIYKMETHRCTKKSSSSKKSISAGVFPCEVCGTVFRGKKMLWSHLENIHVSDEVKFRCQRPECGKKFNNRRRLLFHIELHHQDGRVHLCSECGRTFKLRSTLMKHVRLHGLSLEERLQYNRNRIDKNKGPLGSYECKDCDRVYARRIYLKEHIKYKHEPGSWKYKCPICEKPYFKKQRLLSHIKTHDPSFMSPDSITKKLNTHSKDVRTRIEMLRPFQCPVCSKRFKYKAFLLTHQKVDHGSHPTIQVISRKETQPPDISVNLSPIGQDTPVSDAALSRVIPKVDEKIAREGTAVLKDEEKEDPNPIMFPFLPYKPQQDEMKTWKCDQCGKTFTKMRALNVHYKIHTGEAAESVTCVISTCNQKFRRKFELKEHMKKKHPKEEIQTKSNELGTLNLSLKSLTDQKFQCHICANFFADKKYLGRHLLSHTGAHRKIPCPLCEYKTSTRTLLKGHMRTNHKDNLPEEEKNRWTCDTCQKSFAAERNLREHKLIHTGEIFRFPCPIASCGERFRSKTSQASHLFTYHSETLSQTELNRWKCMDCNKTFGNRKNLTEHQRMHKGIHLRMECSICGLGMRHRAALESHIRSKHKKRKKVPQKAREVSPELPVKRGRGRPRKRVMTSSSSSNEEEEGDGESRISLGTFWRCDICLRSFSSHRGVGRAEHMRNKHAVTPLS